MARSSSFFLTLSLLALTLASTLAATNVRHATKYIVRNRAAATLGGARFDREIGAEHAKLTMAAATDFILNKVFRQTSENDRKRVPTVKLIVVDADERGLGETPPPTVHVVKNMILIGTEYFAGVRGDVKKDFDAVIYRQMARIWQWNGHGRAPEGLITGMADFVLLKAGYEASNWAPPGAGDIWDEGFDITARFLDYCNDIWEGFVAELSKLMKNGYSDDLFLQLTGKTVDQLWTDYKATYAHSD